MGARSIAPTARSQPILILIAALLFAAAALVPLGLDRNAPPAPPAPADPALPVSTVADPVAPVAPAAAIEALRRRDCAAALEALRRAASPGDDTALIEGLYAHACEQIQTAEEALTAARRPGGPLEDWRLWILADSAQALGHEQEVAGALEELLQDHPSSPLRPRALARAAELAWQRGDAATALAWIDAGRREETRGEVGQRLERLAWTIGTALGDRDIRETAARRLLVDFPFTASQLEVVELFRHAGGKVDWSSLLSEEELLRRAEVLLEARQARSALATLEHLPEAQRQLRWRLIAARALTALERGGEAVALLAEAHPATARERAALEWELAEAKLEQATVRRGRQALPTARRTALRQAADLHRERVASLGADPELAAEALRRLFADRADEERFEAAIVALERLRRIDPRDRTGARYLWNRGWAEYGKRNYTGAIGYWGELAGLYPETFDARRARYWSGRAFEALGERGQAEDIFREVANADTTDLYRRHALARMGEAPVEVAGNPVAERWPEDPLLKRAELLHELGLGDLAQAEIEAHRGKVEPRAVAALNARILAAQGERRASIRELARAFDALGSAHQAQLPEDALRMYYPFDFREAVEGAARGSGLPAPLVLAVIRQESAFDRQAVSHAGARGLMQLMPATGREVAQRIGLPFSPQVLHEPDSNLRLGTTYLSQVLRMFDGNLELALAGYNAGPYRVKRLWGKHSSRELDAFLEGLPLEEPKTYVRRIVLFMDSYQRLYPELS